MKYELGSCLLQQRLGQAGLSIQALAAELKIRPERLMDYMEDRRVMPLKTALSIAATLNCDPSDLYELIPQQ
ncbi:transcriptional regulator [Paenibacillus sp. CAA11]|uniref:helix-turn-helix domain-containing protein n=1 Tax=Paenibacillus sp. CAA11 TaxID=1532905 RepID=UPI000D33F651|nr:helix-turn-helix transcriptional regulator [Paenibacillus sp. CAA11]AWB44773.1 transcriptional regulator [Paenibacillus sp. CAA11]